MGYAEWQCPNCRRVNMESVDGPLYGSPIRFCKECKSEYLDKRWKEPAIDNDDYKSHKPAAFLAIALGFMICGLICYLACVFISNTKEDYPSQLLLCVFICLFGCVASFIVYFRKSFGVEKKMEEKAMKESLARLKNPEYAEKLAAYGYLVPTAFLSKNSDTADKEKGI